MLKITLLGTGATMPRPQRALSAAVLECAGHGLLMDCGEGTQAAAQRAGVSLAKLDVICLTHYHGDHIFGLPGLLQTIGCQGRTKPLYIAGPKGLTDPEGPLMLLCRLAGRMPYPLLLLTLPPEGVKLEELAPGWPAGARLRPVPTCHRVESQGYTLELARAGRFTPEKARALGIPQRLWGALQRGQPVEAGGRMVQPEEVLGPPRRGLKVVFSGDTAPCEGLEQAARGADLLICDATYPDDRYTEQAQTYGHSTFCQSAALAARAGAKRLLLTHYSPMIADPEEHLSAAREIFPETCCGQDGLSLTLKFEQNE